MRAFLTISFLHHNQETPYLVLWYRNKNYIFNMPPLYQRIFRGKGMNSKSSSLIFVTSLTSANINGFLGYIASQSSKHFTYQTKIYGPPNLSEFLFRRRFYLGVHSFKYSSYDFSPREEAERVSKKLLLGIKDPYEMIKLNEKYHLKEILNNFECIHNLQKESLNDASANIDEKNFQFSDANATFNPILISDSNGKTVIAYVCNFKKKELPPKIRNSDIKNYGLSYADIKQIVNEKKIKLKNGKTLTLEELAPTFKMDEWSFLIVDCLNQSIMKKLIENPDLIQKIKNIQKLRFVIHLGSLSNFGEKDYLTWLKNFKKSCIHIFCCSELQQSKQDLIEKKLPFLNLLFHLNKYFPDHFPRLKNSAKLKCDFEERLQKIKENVTNSIVADHHNFYEILENGEIKSSALNQPFGKFSFKANENFMQHYQAYQARKANYKPKFDNFDPKIIFLGTNSNQPTNTRNISAIVFDMLSFHILMDCGEGTYFQMLSHFGPDKINEVLLSLKVVFVSHFHLDHTMGLTELLVERNKLIKKMGKNPEEYKLFLVIPPNLLPALEDFHNLIEPILEKCLFVMSNNLSSSIKKELTYSSSEKLSKKILDADDEITVDEFLSPQKLNNLFGSLSSTFASNRQIFNEFLASQKLEFNTVNTPHCQGSHAIIMKHQNGVKIVYSGDTKYSEDLIREGKDATLLIHEATFLKNPSSSQHSSIREAIDVGMKMKAWRTVLTHFSKSSYNLDPKNVVKASSSSEVENNKELEKYASENVVLAVDHLKGKLSEFEYLPAINKCLNIIHPEDI